MDIVGVVNAAGGFGQFYLVFEGGEVGFKFSTGGVHFYYELRKENFGNVVES